MAYSLPVFNLTVNIWRATSTPAVDPPDVTSDCNLAWGRRVGGMSTGGTGAAGVLAWAPVLLLPPLTDVRSDEKCSAGNDVVEVPAGSGRFYAAQYVEDIGKGFANEHRGVGLQSLGNWPQPIP